MGSFRSVLTRSQNSFKCSYSTCSKGFKSRSSRQRHERERHKESKVSCPRCHWGFARRYLREHLKLHNRKEKTVGDQMLQGNIVRAQDQGYQDVENENQAMLGLEQSSLPRSTQPQEDLENYVDHDGNNPPTSTESPSIAYSFDIDVATETSVPQVYGREGDAVSSMQQLFQRQAMFSDIDSPPPDRICDVSSMFAAQLSFDSTPTAEPTNHLQLETMVPWLNTTTIQQGLSGSQNSNVPVDSSTLTEGFDVNYQCLLCRPCHLCDLCVEFLASVRSY